MAAATDVSGVDNAVFSRLASDAALGALVARRRALGRWRPRGRRRSS